MAGMIEPDRILSGGKQVEEGATDKTVYSVSEFIHI